MSVLDIYNSIPEDKKAHLNLGLVLGLLFGSHVYIALGVVLLVAIGKEVYDEIYNVYTGTKTHGVELLDAVATAVGGLVGIGLVHLVGAVL